MPLKSPEENVSPSAVKVYVRVRPFIDREISLGDTQSIVTPYRDTTTSIKLLDPNSYYKPRDVCNFDECWFSMHDQEFPYVSQEDIYEKTGADACANVFAGYNSCIMAYGQTGSGKTHTMLGEIMKTSERGVIPRVCDTLLAGCARSNGSLSLQCTYYEIYNERVVDLLDRARRDELRVRNDPVTGPYIEGLSTHRIRQAKDVMHLLGIGNKERHVAHTKLSKQSSRSHAILTLQLIKQDTGKLFSKLNLVDLAGSERTAMSEVEGVHFKEATKINLSLTTLGRVIDALADQANGISGILPPYRESLLTWLLSDSLGGNSKTCMIATISPSSVNFEETLNTLRYASRAREIVNICVTNDDPYEKRVKELTALVDYLRRQLSSQNASPGKSPRYRDDSSDIFDQGSVSHYKQIISKLHHQVNKLSQENHELERKYKEEKAAHMLTLQTTHQETRVMRKELDMFRSFSSIDVLTTQKHGKPFDHLHVKSGESPGPEGRRSSSFKPRPSATRLEKPQAPEPKPVSADHFTRVVEKYARELNKLQKEYCSKGNEIIEIHTSLLSKSTRMSTPRLSTRTSAVPLETPPKKRSVAKRKMEVSVSLSVQPDEISRETASVKQLENEVNALKDAHAKEIAEVKKAKKFQEEKEEAESQEVIRHLEQRIHQQDEEIASEKARATQFEDQVNTLKEEHVKQITEIANSYKADRENAETAREAAIVREWESKVNDMKDAHAKEIATINASRESEREKDETESNKVFRNLEDLIQQKDEAIIHEKAITEELEHKVEELKDTHEKEIAEIRSLSKSEREKDETESNKVVTHLENLLKQKEDAISQEKSHTATLESQIASLKENHSQQITAINAAHASRREKEETESNKVVTHLEELIQQKDKAIAREKAISKELEDKTQKLTEAHSKTIAELTATHQSERANEQTESNKVVAHLENLIQEQGEKLAAMETESTASAASFQKYSDTTRKVSLLTLERTIRRDLSELQDADYKALQAAYLHSIESQKHLGTIHTLQSEITEMQRTFSSEKESLKESHAEKQAQLESHHRVEMESLDKSHAQIIRQLEAGHALVVKDMNTKLESLQAQNIQSENTLQEKTKQFKQAFDKERALQADRESQLKEDIGKQMYDTILKEKEEEAAQKIASLEKEHALLVDRIEKGKDSEIAALKGDFTAREKTLHENHESSARNLREEFTKELLERETEFNRNLRVHKEEHNHELAKIETRAAEKLRKAIKDSEKNQSAASTNYEAERKAQDEIHQQQLDEVRKTHQSALDKMCTKALVDHQSAEARHRMALVAMHAETMQTLKVQSQAVRNIHRSFTDKISTVRKLSENSFVHCLIRGELEARCMSAKYQPIIELVQSMHAHSMQERKAASAERTKLHGEITVKADESRFSNDRANFEVKESQIRLQIFNAHLEKTIALHSRFFEEKASHAVSETTSQYSEQLDQQRKDLESKCAESLRLLETSKESHAKDHKAVGAQISTFQKYLNSLNTSMASWQDQQCALVAGMFSQMSVSQTKKMQGVYDETVKRHKEERESDKKIAKHELQTCVKTMNDNAAALQAFAFKENLARETIAAAEVRSLQEIYSIRAVAWHEREKRLYDAIDILEAAGAVATDSAKEQQSVIRKLESTIELYKVLQLEGELGMQSGIAHV